MLLRPFLALALAAALAVPASAQTFIDFDFDTNGDPINAPGVFSATTRLTTL